MVEDEVPVENEYSVVPFYLKSENIILFDRRDRPTSQTNWHIVAEYTTDKENGIQSDAKLDTSSSKSNKHFQQDVMKTESQLQSLIEHQTAHSHISDSKNSQKAKQSLKEEQCSNL